MSIVNDALKKAGKEFEFKTQDVITSGRETAPGPDKKWPVIIPAIFIIMALAVVAFMLYKNASRPNPDYAANESGKPASAVQSALNNIEQKNIVKSMKSQDIAKLNGIVYGDEGKWAIVNDKIVKEGDNLLDGEIVSISRDFVKIQKKDGSELTLSLK